MNYIIRDYTTSKNSISSQIEDFAHQLNSTDFNNLVKNKVEILEKHEFQKIKQLDKTAIIIDDDIHSISRIIWFLNFNNLIINTVCFDSIYSYNENLNILKSHNVKFVSLDFHLGSKPIEIFHDTSKVYNSLKDCFNGIPILGYTNYESSGHPDSNKDTKELINLFYSNYDSVFDKNNIDNKDAYNNIVRDKIRISELLKSKRQLENEVSQLNSQIIKSRASQSLDKYLRSNVVNILLRESIIGKSKEIRKVQFQIERFANNNTPILVTGERGVGKELVARGLHRLDKKRSSVNKFISFDCGRDDIPESTFFGSEKGSFTDSIKQTQGLFERANRGVLFLDEIGNLSLKNQKILLRVLQEKKFIRVGGDKELPSDFRLVCATNKNLNDMVKQGLFQADLLDRIKGLQIQVPPLRDRKQDIEDLLLHFITDKNILFSSQAILALKYYDYPGNIRELKNIIDSILAYFESGDVVEMDDVLEEIKKRGWSTESDYKVLEIVDKMLEIVESDDLKSKIRQSDIAKDWPNKKDGSIGISRDVFVTDYYGKHKNEIISIISFDTIKYEPLISKCTWISKHILG